MKFQYDVIVIGAGHAGCEAAAASATLGAKTCLMTIDMNKMAQMWADDDKQPETKGFEFMMDKIVEIHEKFWYYTIKFVFRW